MALLEYIVSKNAAMDARTAQANNGKLKGYTGARPAQDGAITGTLLFTCTFGATAYGASVAGVATANAIASDSNPPASGTVGYCVVEKSDGTTVLWTGTVGTSGADFNFDSLSITAGNQVNCTGSTLTQG